MMDFGSAIAHENTEHNPIIRIVHNTKSLIIFLSFIFSSPFIESYMLISVHISKNDYILFRACVKYQSVSRFWLHAGKTIGLTASKASLTLPPGNIILSHHQFFVRGKKTDAVVHLGAHDHHVLIAILGDGLADWNESNSSIVPIKGRIPAFSVSSFTSPKMSFLFSNQLR